MAYERPGSAVRVVAGAAVRHGALAADDGHVGRAIKTLTPSQTVARADRDLINVAEEYNLRPRGVSEQPIVQTASSGRPAYDLTGITKGALVYIVTATNALELTAGAGKIPAGKCTHLAAEQGTPAGYFRLDLEQKA